MTSIVPWQPQPNNIYHMDALTLLRHMPDESCNVVSDFPYGTDFESWDISVTDEIIYHTIRVSQHYAIIFYSNTRLYQLLPALRSQGVDVWIIAWVKKNAMQFARRFASNWSPIVVAYRKGAPFFGKDYVEFPMVKQDVNHPSPKPVELMEWLIKRSCPIGSLILDPFMGSGTTAVAAQRLGRQYIGCDISAEYVEIARRRVQNSDPYKDTITDNGMIQKSLFAEVK